MKNTAASLYLDLLKKSILEELYVENEVRLIYLRECVEGADVFDMNTLLNIADAKAEMLAEYIRLRETGINYGRNIKNLGFQHSMMGRKRMDHLHECLDIVHADGVPGDLIECGVWRGGGCVFMRGFLAANGITDRTVYVADSFEGLPAPTAAQDKNLDLSKELFPMLAISLENVRDLFARYGLLDDQVQFLKGWFKDTLPKADIEKLAILRLDGDLYESTMDGLVNLYDKLSPGGFAVIDDYGCLEPCRQAVHDFRNAHGITAEIVTIDWTGSYWRKP